VRERAGLRGIDDLELVAREGARITFRADGRLYEVGVTPADGGLTYLTCDSTALRHPRHYAATVLRESAA
jgi:hypothetical protein